jgi:hypothetical protein
VRMQYERVPPTSQYESGVGEWFGGYACIKTLV